MRPPATPQPPSQAELNRKLFATLVSNDVEEARRLLEQGAEVTARDSGGDSLLTTWRSLKPELITLFIEHGADVNAKNRFGEPALSCMIKNEAGVRVLLAAQADPNIIDMRNKSTPLIKAAEGGHEGAVRALLEAGADPQMADSGGNTPLLLALSRGHAAIARLLIENGADITAVNNYKAGVFHCACASKGEDSDILTFLAEQGAEGIDRPDGTSGDTPLMRAATLTNANKLRLLIRMGVRLNAQNVRGATPLMMAVNGNHPEAVQVLLEAGANPNIKDVNGNTPLARALSMGHLPIARLLLAKGADPTLRNKRGETMLHCACKNANDNLSPAGGGKTALVDLVIDRVADIDAVDAEGNTAMHYAGEHLSDKVVPQLLAKGAQSGLPNNKGMTPMMLAAEQVNFLAHISIEGCAVDISDTAMPHMTSIARDLINAGADPGVLNNDGVSMLDILKEAGHAEMDEAVREMLKAYADFKAKAYQQQQHDLSANRQERLKRHGAAFRPKL